VYGKLFASTFTGSMLGTGPVVFSVWAYVIAHTVKEEVELNPRLLATTIGCSPEEVQTAITYLCSPDPESRNPAEEGRRLVRNGQYQYRVVSHSVYNAVRDEEARREYLRNYKAEQREDEDFRREENQKRQERRERNAPSTMSRQLPSTPSSNTEPHTDCGGGGGGGRAESAYGSSASPKQIQAFQDTKASTDASETLNTEGDHCGGPAPQPPTAADLAKTFGGISPRIQHLADVLGQHLGVAQDLDFTSIEIKHVPVLEEAPEELVAQTAKYVLFGKNDYWRDLMMDECDGAGGLKLLIRAFAKISEQAKSRGSSTTPKRTLNAQRGAGKRKTQVNLKAESVVPKPEDLILEAEELL
jgi:hypothetical protein